MGVISNSKIDFIPETKAVQDNTRRRYYIWEGCIDDLLALVPKITPEYSFPNKPYRPFSKFPPTTRDIAFMVKKDKNINEMRSTILDSDSKVLLVELFDVFSSEKLGENNISYAFHIVLDDNNETMTSETGDRILQKISHTLVSKFQATIR